jgi:hypothetical protein
MPILNLHRMYYLYTMRNEGPDESKLERRHGAGALAIRNFGEAPIYYYEFRLANAFKVFPLSRTLFPTEIKKIKDKQAFLAVNNSHEAFHDVVDGIYESLVIEQGIPAEQIILLSESADIGSAIEESAKKYNLPKIKGEWILQFEWNTQMCRRIMLREKRNVIETLISKEYPKKFLNFNRRWRPHRVQLVALMKSLGILDQGHVSLGEADDHNSWGRMWHWIKFLGSHNPEMNELFEKHENSIISLPPLYLDTQNLVDNKADLDWTTNYLYAESYFSVVTETNFYTNTLGVAAQPGRFLSEKTFKPISMKHPFIIVSVPGMLDKLKELGYKTFSPWIDESYDQELDDNTRLLKIAKEIKRLCNLSPSEFNVFLRECKKITDHNFDVFINKDKFFYRVNYDASELTINTLPKV